MVVVVVVEVERLLVLCKQLQRNAKGINAYFQDARYPTMTTWLLLLLLL